MMEILSGFLRNFPVAWSPFIAGNVWWDQLLSIELGYDYLQTTRVEKSTNHYIWVSSLTMKKERQNEQNFTVKEKINCRKANANSLIDLRIDDYFSNVLDKVRGSAESLPNDSIYFQTT